jgi:RNA polymerase sigma factor, sigma-70 family/RNA polymerase sigma factor, TIGR02999 family
MADSSDNRKTIDDLFEAISDGDTEAKNELLPLIYDELRRQAHSRLRYKRESHTLQTTGLVHEAYINLVRKPAQDWKNRSYFFKATATLMRQILIQHMRNRRRLKRGGGHEHPDIDVEQLPATRDKELLLLDEALSELERVDKTLAELVERRYFAGQSIEETAKDMNISPATVKRKWKHAKAWLKREMKR